MRRCEVIAGSILAATLAILLSGCERDEQPRSAPEASPASGRDDTAHCG